MIKALLALITTGNVTQSEMFPELPQYNNGLPRLTNIPCNKCEQCIKLCTTEAISLNDTEKNINVNIDLGRCIACGKCSNICPTETIKADRRTNVAARSREDLILSQEYIAKNNSNPETIFKRSIHIREVSTGDSGSDMEIAAINNPIFDASRFGIHFVASPRFADALIVTGPVARPMQEPLRRCYNSMASPRLVIAAGAPAITGVPYSGGYANANGVDAILPVDVYIPGFPPHPWYILHGILLAMGHPALQSKY